MENRPVAKDISKGAVTAPRLNEKPRRLSATPRPAALSSDTTALVAVFSMPPPKP